VVAGICVATGAKLSTRSQEFTVRAGDDGTQGIARCKRGQRVASGGFVGENVPGKAVIMPAESARVGKRKWRYAAGNPGEADGTAVAYAYCDRDAPKLRVRRASETAGNPTAVELTARCERGEEAVAGGFEGNGEAAAYVYRSRRAGKRGWEVGLFHLNISGGPVTYTALAYCDQSEPGLNERENTENLKAIPKSQPVAVGCKRREKLRAGGFEAEYDVPVAAATVNASRRSGKRGWQTRAFPLAGSPELTAYAYCEENNR
jgi:hypothetical protein